MIDNFKIPKITDKQFEEIVDQLAFTRNFEALKLFFVAGQGRAVMNEVNEALSNDGGRSWNETGL